MHWVYTQVEEAIKFINDGNIIDEDLALEIQTAINEHNLELASKLIQMYEIKLPEYATYTVNTN